MKKLLLLLALIITLRPVHAQMVLEHTYDSVIYGNMINLSAAGNKYVMISNQPDEPLRIYNLDHSIYRYINTAQIPGCSAHLVGELVSDHLFNADNLIEYLVTYSCSPSRIMIQNENGQILDSVLGYSPDLYRDDLGNYKLLVREANQKLNVYSLPGTIPCVGNCGVFPLNVHSPVTQDISLSDPVPNPAGTYTTIYFTLPPGINDAAISIFNMSGQRVRKYNVKDTDKELKVKSSDLPSGHYYYYLETSGRITTTRKLVILN